MRDDSRTIKDKYGELLTPRSFTWEKGCASHSNFQSERDKVLDELDMYLDGELERASQFNAMGTFALLEVKRKIKGLRQKAGEP
jgi:hypothetical protein